MWARASLKALALPVLAGCAATASPEPAVLPAPLPGAAQIVAIPSSALDSLTKARLQREVTASAMASGRPHRIGTDFPPNLILFIEDRASGPTGLIDVDRPDILTLRAELATKRRCAAARTGGVIVGHVPASSAPTARAACIRALVGAALGVPRV